MLRFLLKWQKICLNKRFKGKFKTPVKGEKAKRNITFAKEHMPEMHP